MIQIGLTGGIGSGKTTVAKIFEVLGVPVYYADIAARRLMQEDEGLKNDIIRHFGSESYINGQLNRAHISSAVFSDPLKRTLLNSLVHPVTIADAAHWMSTITYPYAIKEAALIFESDAHLKLDFIIGVSSPLTMRAQRVMVRDKISFEEVEKRMASQMDEAEKMKRCDFILINDEQILLIPQVIKIHEQLLKM